MKFSGKNLLFFFPESPFSKRAGNVLRTYTNLKQLKSLGLNIDLVGVEDYYKSFGDSLDDIDPEIIDEVFILKTNPPKKKLTVEYWKYKIQKKFSEQNPNQYLTQYLKDNLSTILDKKKYDYIIINYEFWTDIIRNQDLKGAKTIIDTHDWITLNEFYNNKNLDLGKKFNEEIRNLSFYDKVVTISNDEYFIFKSFLGDKVVNIPPSFPENFEDTNTEKKYDLIFVGSDNPFNVLSINWFVEKVLPLLSKEIKVCIIGRICKHVPDHESIEKVFFADDLETYYHSSKIAICPMLKGTGIKIKVVEAMSYGLPIVGTEKAVDGFSDKKNNGCMVSDDEKEFAEIINHILKNNSEYLKLKNEATKFFQQNFSEEKSLELWKKMLNLEITNS